TGIVVYKDHEKEELKAEYDKALAAKEKELRHKFEYEVEQLEVKGVKIGLDTGVRTIEIYTGGVGSNGGTLAAAAPPPTNPVSGAVKAGTKDEGTQNNDGKGLVE
ncbi:MAG: hypothetical protein ACYSR7_04455, partial [Planctomycetota bacterium]